MLPPWQGQPRRPSSVTTQKLRGEKKVGGGGGTERKTKGIRQYLYCYNSLTDSRAALLSKTPGYGRIGGWRLRARVFVNKPTNKQATHRAIQQGKLM